MKTPLFVQVHFLTFFFCCNVAILADTENIREKAATDAVSLLEKHVAFLDEHYRKAFEAFGHRADGQHFVLLPKSHLLKNKAFLLKLQMEQADTDEKKKALYEEWIQQQRQLVETVRKLSFSTRSGWKVGTIVLSDYLDILDMTRDSNIELLRAAEDKQAVQKAWDDYQMGLGTFRGEAEELHLLKQYFRRDDLYTVRLALFEVRYECAVWRLRHSTFPKRGPINGVPQPVWSPHKPEKELNKQIRQHLDDQLRTAEELVAATEVAWKAGTRTPTDLVEALRRKKKVELRILRHEAKPEETKIAEVLERHIKQTETFAKRQEEYLSTILGSPGTVRRAKFYLNQFRLFAVSLEIERLRLRQEYADNATEKEKCLEEIRQTLDSATGMMQSVSEDIKSFYDVGICTQKNYLDTLERLVRLKMQCF